MAVLLADRLLPGVADWADELTAIRHDLHSHPERGFDTDRTVGVICENLRKWGVTDINTEFVKGAVIAVIEGTRPGHTIGIRADMDCLPMNDHCGKEYASQNEGLAHTCGHDGHTTWLLGTARYLAAHRDFPGKVVLIFQPAEEISRGAQTLVKAGLLEKYGIEEIYGGHTEPTLPQRSIGFQTGPLQAASDKPSVTVKGFGTHGGRPHLGVDPIPVAAQIVTALQTIVSRKINPIDTAVLSICSINAGRFEAVNIVPAQCTLSGTIRTFLPETRAFVEETVKTMVPAIAKANGCEAEVEYVHECGSVINTPAQTEAALKVTGELLGEDHVKVIDPFMSSEDFSEYLQRVPGCIIRVGIKDEDHAVSLHNPNFDFNDEVLPVAVSVVANMAIKRLEALAS